jgi:hypothetical protein
MAAEAAAVATADALTEGAPEAAGEAAPPGAHAARNVAAPPAPISARTSRRLRDPADQPVVVIEVDRSRLGGRLRSRQAHSGALLGDRMRRTLRAEAENGLRRA